MYKEICFFILSVFMTLGTAFAEKTPGVAGYVGENAYNNLYPFMNNKMRVALNPGTSPTKLNSQIGVVMRSDNTAPAMARRVVPRKGRSLSNSTTNIYNNVYSPTGFSSARTATAPSPNATYANKRQVISRAPQKDTGKNTIENSERHARATAPTGNNATQQTDYIPVSSSRCLADYTQCMDAYCQRENTPYNRCYCSPKLSQIDAEYQPVINDLIMKMLTMKNEKYWTDEEMNEYWMDKVGKYTGENSWAKLDDALNIEWSAMESRVRGQNAFVTGHEYCVQHLQSCFYMAANLQDAYRSQIARDCKIYENSLQRIKNAAESIVESYK